VDCASLALQVAPVSYYYLMSVKLADNFRFVSIHGGACFNRWKGYPYIVLQYTAKSTQKYFRCMKFKPLVIWIWNQNIAISTIVGTSSHMIIGVT
jgi:hypothetical protein